MLKSLFTCILALLLVGCGAYQGSNTGHDYKNTKLRASSQANSLLSKSNSVSGKLEAVEQLLIAERIQEAESIYSRLSAQKLNDYEISYMNIVGAKLQLAKHNVNAAQKKINQVWTPHQLPKELQLKFFSLRSEIYRRANNLPDAIQERVYLAKHLDNEDDIKDNNKQIWEMLSELTPNTLKNLETEDYRSELNGWIKFAKIVKHYDLNATAKNKMLSNWKSNFPSHPAITFMPDSFKNIADNSFYDLEFKARNIDAKNKVKLTTPKHIALLLPLQAQHKKSAQTIRDGFLSSFYAQKDLGDKPKISVFDTSEGKLYESYQQAIANGADFIVGPLIKEDIESLINNTDLAVPLLALNNIDSKVNKDLPVFQFGLSPEEETIAVAEKAWKDGHRNAVIIAPKTITGKRLQKTFKNTWQNMGGTIIENIEISSSNQLNQAIQKMLHIDDSNTRANELRQMGIKFNFEPRRRQDINMIFIATGSQLSRQLKPMLNFYYAANVPAYSISSIYNGKPSANLDQDLNGIKFCDMPWVLDRQLSAKSTTSELEANNRLYALGMDAYKVAMQIEQLKMFPDLGISGVTGMLTLSPENRLNRKLIWAQFKRGIPIVNGEAIL